MTIERTELYNGALTLLFDTEKHLYSVEDHSVDPEVVIPSVPSVTGITKMIDKSAPLMWWAVDQCIQFVETNIKNVDPHDEVEWPNFLRQARKAHMGTSSTAADIGTLVHDWIDKYLGAKHPEMPTNPQARQSIETFMEWAEKVKLTPFKREFKVYSRRHNYAGTCDFMGLINDELCIADWKTSKAVYPEYGLQLSGYKEAKEEETGHTISARWCIALPKDGGKVKAKRFDPDTDVRDLHGFLGARALHRALREKK